MIRALIAGQSNPEKLAELAQRRLRNKIPELRLALEGRVRNHHRFLLAEYLEEWEAIGQRIERIEAEIERRMGPFEYAVALWQTIPGIDRVTASSLVAEIGVNMEQFPSAGHLASWAPCVRVTTRALESASQARPAMATAGSGELCAKPLGRPLTLWSVQTAAARRGVKRAVIAVAHTMLVIAYTMLKNSRSYQDLGGNYLEQIHKDHLRRYFVKRLQRLGLKVTIEPATAAA